MPAPIGPVSGPRPIDRTASAAAVAPAQASMIPMALLLKSNPGLAKMMKDYPAIAAFLAKQPAGAIADVKAGDVQTKVTYNLWFHSPVSLNGTFPWRDQFVFVYTNDGTGGTIDFGDKGQHSGRLIAVYRLGDLDVEVKSQRGFEGGTSSDGGFETQVVALASGKAGVKGSVHFATGCLDADGNAMGDWGLGNGYPGREWKFTHGTAVEAPIHEDYAAQQLFFLRKDATGKWVKHKMQSGAN